MDVQLLSYATVKQAEYLEAVDKYGSNNKAAQALGVNRRVLDKSVARVHVKAASMGYAPQHDMTRTVPDGFKVKGVSTYYNAEGKAAGQWVKSSADDAKRAEYMQAAAAAMAEELPRLSPVAGPLHTSQSLCNLFTLTDCHVGMLAWHKEGGADWDLKIAEDTLVGCFEHMVANSPSASVALVNQLGDFLHYDSLAPVTPTSGHIVDADGRFSKMVSVAIRTLRRVVDCALARHDKVVILLCEGNHDMASSVWLRHMFKALYENEPRISVVDSELPYYTYQHGDTMLAFHHGHLSKNEQLPIFFASKFAKMWGDTTRRYAHSGHRHHTHEKEYNGMTVHQHPTLAATDAYSARAGYVTDRRVTALTYHTKHGEVARNSVVPEMLN